ncbi:hypothetical protein UO65_2755 [Actinokineospora spheciospongiae]|uniref:Uncharacterized protein n=1 Tax=Actinokineospora spheciospongiae TaxID=909613 RepID=W7IZF2_9PSEU|nr:hypothetical protein [Actinokineospora spheciospongiae]EWC61931.1 hypothetical protein UO65_2755 [Actinokineospora spheciospongiae]
MDRRGDARRTRLWALERRLVAAMVLVVAVSVLMLLVGMGLFAGRGGLSPTDGAAGAPPESVRSRTTPFDGTPASGWAEGAAGIVPPPPAPVGPYDAAQVAAATSLVRDALVASRLDPNLVTGHDPTGYLGLLAPDAAAALRPLFGTGREPEAQALVSLADPASPLLPVPPRVTGGMRVEEGEEGELVVHTNYLFAYAFDAPPGAVVDPMDAVVVVRADVDYVLRIGGKWTRSSQGLWYGDVAGYGYSIACDAYKRGFLAPTHTDRDDRRPLPRPDPGAYFDPSAPLPAEIGCPP